MSISDGQKVNAVNSNTAWVSRTTDDNKIGKFDLENIDADSGGSITNVQRELNAEGSYTGKGTNTVENSVPTYSSDAIGVANEDLTARSGALTAQVGTNVTNIAANTSDIADIRTTQGTSDGDQDMGTYTAGANGFAVTDNTSVKVNTQELIDGVDARQLLSEKGAANGYPELDGTGRIPSAQLPTSATEYRGAFDASGGGTGSPSLTDGVGTNGDLYRVSVAGTVDHGAGNVTYAVGDAVIYNGSVWQKIPANDIVTSVASKIGDVLLDTDDVTEATNLYYTETRVSANTDVAANTAKVSADGSIDTHSDVDTTTNPPSTGEVLTWDGSDWAPVALPDSGSTSINYIINPNIENNTDNINVTANVTKGSDSVTPLFNGTSVTFSTATIATTADYFEFDMNDVDLAILGRELICRFWYRTDANFTSGDYQLKLRNVDSGVDIDVSNDNDGNLQFSSDGAEFIGRAQVDSTDNTYTLRAYVVNAPSSASLITVDKINVGPEQFAPGYIGTDWEVFTPTGTFTTNTSYEGTFRRVGDSIEMNVKMDFSGSPNATTSFINLPNGLLADISKIGATTDLQSVGYGEANDSSASSVDAIEAVVQTSNNTRLLLRNADGSANPNVTNTAPFSFANNDFITIFATVPIEGWKASNLVSTTQTLFQNVVCRAYLNSSQTVSTGATTQINLDTISFDTHNSFDTSANTFTAPVSGKYRVTGHISWSGAGTASNIQARIHVNSVLAAFATDNYVSSATNRINVNDILDLTKGDVVDLNGFQNTGGNLTASGTTTGCFMSIEGIPDFSVFGVFGETKFLEAQGSTDPTVSGQFADIVSIPLTAGEWELDGTARFSSSTTAANEVVLAISENTGNTTTDHVGSVNENTSATTTTSADVNINVVRYRVIVSENQTYYLKSRFATVDGGISIVTGYISGRKIK